MDGLLGTGDRGGLHSLWPGLVDVLDLLAVGVDLCAIAILLLGALRFVVTFLRAELTRDARLRGDTIARDRIALGRYIMAALELLIVSDIIHTALSLALADLLFLGLLVLIRSLISYFLERELTGLERELAE